MRSRCPPSAAICTPPPRRHRTASASRHHTTRSGVSPPEPQGDGWESRALGVCKEPEAFACPLLLPGTCVLSRYSTVPLSYADWGRTHGALGGERRGGAVNGCDGL